MKISKKVVFLFLFLAAATLGIAYLPISTYTQDIWYTSDGYNDVIAGCLVKKYLIGGTIATVPLDVEYVGIGDLMVTEFKWNESTETWDIYKTI